MKKKQKEITFYSTRGIIIMVVVVLVFAFFALFGMASIGVVTVPSFISGVLGENENTPALPPSANIAPEKEKQELFEAVGRSDYAKALADIPLPQNYYRSYKISYLYGDSAVVNDYITVVNGDDWWVQTYEDGVIISTALCKDGRVKITDNTRNSSIFEAAYSEDNKNGIKLKERTGVIPLIELVEMIHDLSTGEDVSYGGGINDYLLSFTKSTATNETLFSFSFDCKNGISEAYTFSFENATILSATKSMNGEIIYKLESKDYRNDLEGIDTDALININ